MWATTAHDDERGPVVVLAVAQRGRDCGKTWFRVGYRHGEGDLIDMLEETSAQVPHPLLVSATRVGGPGWLRVTYGTQRLPEHASRDVGHCSSSQPGEGESAGAATLVNVDQAGGHQPGSCQLGDTAVDIAGVHGPRAQLESSHPAPDVSRSHRAPDPQCGKNRQFAHLRRRLVHGATADGKITERMAATASSNALLATGMSAPKPKKPWKAPGYVVTDVATPASRSRFA